MCLANVCSKATIDLSGNRLSGTIPTQIGDNILLGKEGLGVFADGALG